MIELQISSKFSESSLYYTIFFSARKISEHKTAISRNCHTLVGSPFGRPPQPRVCNLFSTILAANRGGDLHRPRVRPSYRARGHNRYCYGGEPRPQPMSDRLPQATEYAPYYSAHPQPQPRQGDRKFSRKRRCVCSLALLGRLAQYRTFRPRFGSVVAPHYVRPQAFARGV